MVRYLFEFSQSRSNMIVAVIIYFDRSRAYKYKKKVKIYIIEITLLQSSVQKKIVSHHPNSSELIANLNENL